jgi:L-ascorbate metabolism protein UlaG (beta-lactamase superfamily)
MLREKRSRWPSVVSNKGVPNLHRKLAPGSVAVTFVNHATFLLQTSGLNILTDPVWSDRASPWQWIGPKRVRKPGIPFDELPWIDLILISHNHYDHFDVHTLEALNSRFNPGVIAPLGNARLPQSTGFKNVTEVDWWDSIQFEPQVTITFGPTQHFSGRTYGIGSKACGAAT